MIASMLALAASAAWGTLAFARGGFWRGRENDARFHRALQAVPPGVAWPRVTAVVPARDEAEVIGASLASLLGQRYPGDFDVVLVDDHSDDGTAALAASTAAALGRSDRLTVLAAPPLPAGWTGKLWALSTGIDHASRRDAPPDFWLLTDADIAHGDDALAALVLNAVEEGHVLSSLMVRLHCESRAERALIPAFVFFFQMIYPFDWVNRTDRRTAAAAGGCMLVRRDALEAAGGLASIRGKLIDDCALGRRLKSVGRIHLALGDRVRSLRASPSLAPIRAMVVRSAFAQLDRSWARLAFVVVAMAVVFVAPVALAIAAHGWARGLGIACWATMALLFAPIARRYGVSPLSGLALPVVASAYLAFTVESALQHARGCGGQWKGRAQAGHGAAAEAVSR